MGSPVLADVQRASYAPDAGGSSLDFDAQIVEWNDTRKPRIVVHEYLKRDGGEAEYMGRAPFRVKMTAVYVGPNWRKDYATLLATFDASPTGTLVHPMIGQVKVACEGVEGARVSLEELDTVVVPLSFVENNVDQKLEAQSSGNQGAAAKASAVGSFAANVTSAVAMFASATTVAGQLTAAAIGYAASVVTSLSAGATADATLGQQLSTVVAKASATAAAVRADKAATSDAVAFPALLAVEQLLDACAQVDEAARSARPTLMLYIVPATTSLLAIAQRFYGRDAGRRLDEIRNNNPGKIPNPAAVVTGTQLYMATATQPVRIG